MYSSFRIGLFGVVCFMAGTLTVASQPSGIHDGDDDLPIDGTTCHKHACGETDIPTLGPGSAPKIPISHTCSAFDTSKDPNNVSVDNAKNPVAPPINIAGRSVVGFLVGAVHARTRATKKPKRANFLMVPYVYVTVEHCTRFGDKKEQITTQVIRVPWNMEYSPTVETARTPPASSGSSARTRS